MVNIEQNQDLVELPSKEDVKQVVLGLNRESAEGLDGFNDCFSQSC